ncbi:hypothetical protein PTE30175_02321 [Pandoraea terrae]|uniref:Uncharacterized protein n=2 Tax=Pandoraea terrae TaxID=1537710 RepID=A0A5E4V1Q5_9BURK|nr:hypothetical protein PTE30175_02321 [Pandoraea terrae]
MQMSYAGDEGAMAGEMPDCDFMKAPTSVKIKAPFCKATAVCQLGSLYHPVSELAVTGPITSSDSVSDVYIDVLRVRAPDGPWRPPTSL